ncbi:Uu.00g004470.m01.CDS01 [Anthostomella pinea]|uniref:Uu.00g004470.m01.CDS01 n=1 Tax=Anthostomella pinea TaxID=933095 RepID=A0AAI8YIU1_9PEZI|nr:Uu.00g004470.m01.CDS01 [Anthostomella pinea]
MATSPSHSIRVSSAPRIASYSLQDQDHPEIELAQAEHRIRLGNTTAVLAEAIGPSGHIDAVDPGAPDYGSPFTLAQAQAYMSSSSDVAVLSHCIWYFASEQVLEQILKSLKGRVKRVCIAEYALYATEKAAIPHALAVLARGSLESCKAESSENVRSPLSPRAITDIAKRSGWAPAQEDSVVPAVGLLDGSWEVGTVVSPRFLRDLEVTVPNARMRLMIASARDAAMAAVDALDGAQVQTMDVWAAVFSQST